MSLLIDIGDFECFEGVKEIDSRSISTELISTVKKLDEKEELEPFILSILF